MIVATIRALKYHGGVDVKEVNKENLAALEKGLANLERHVDNVPRSTACRAWSRSTASPSTPTAEIELLKRDRWRSACRWCWRRTGPTAARARRTRAHRGRPVREAVEADLRLRGLRPLWDKIKQDRAQGLRRGRRDRRRQGARADQEAAGRRLRPLPGVRGEDPVRRSRPTPRCAARRRTTWSTSARCGSPPAPSSW